MSLLSISLAGWALWLAWYDQRHHRIPNLALIVPAVVTVGFWLSHGHGPFMQSGLDAASGVAVCGLLLLPAYLTGRIGGGDLKLALLIGALLGPVAGFAAMLLSAGLLGATALIRRTAREVPAGPALLGGLMGVVTAPLWVAA